MNEDNLFSTKGKSPSVSHLVNDYLVFLELECQASLHTIKNYKIDLKKWFAFLHSQSKRKDPLQLAQDNRNLRKFVRSESRIGSEKTVRRRLSAVKGFLKYLHRQGIVLENNSRIVSLPSLEEKPQKVWSAQKMVAFIENLPVETLGQKRTRAMVELFYSTGIRLSELVALNEDAIDFRAGTLKILGKMPTGRILPLGRHCQTAIRDYIDSTPVHLRRGKPSPLFLNKEGERLSGRTVQRTLRAVGMKLLGKKGADLTPQMLRHSCAKHLLENGAGLRDVQALLGHRTLVSTQKYDAGGLASAQMAYRQAHPRSKLREKAKESFE